MRHVISEAGIATDPEKTKIVESWPLPTNVKELRSFMEFCGYYRKFIQNFSKLAKCLHKLTEKGRKFEWTNECQSAFEELKNRLVSSPILAHSDFLKTFILDTDASNEAIGAVLSQEIDGKERPIAFASRTLTKPERRYCVTRKELLAVVFFVKQFIVRTDHGSLMWLLNFKNPEGQMARWLQVLNSYDMTIVHRPGRQHRNADALSRIPCRQCGFDPNWENIENLAQHARNIQERETQEVDEKEVSIIEKQKSDKDLTLIRKWVEKREKPELKEFTGESITVKSMWAQFDQLTIIDDVLVRRLEGLNTKLQVIVPMTERRTILSHYHDNRTSAHLGLRKTLAKIRQGYYWPGLQKDVKLYVAGCSFCSQKKPPNKESSYANSLNWVPNGTHSNGHSL